MCSLRNLYTLYDCSYYYTSRFAQFGVGRALRQCNTMASKVTLQLVLRDINHDMVKAWNDPQAFGGDDYKDCVQVSMLQKLHD